jgi:hypothetical protein
LRCTEQELQKEIDGQSERFSSLSHASHKVLGSLKLASERASLELQLAEVSERWAALRRQSLQIRARLESNSTQWAALLASLRQLVLWCGSQRDQVRLEQRQLLPDAAALAKQIDDNKVK